MADWKNFVEGMRKVAERGGCTTPPLHASRLRAEPEPIALIDMDGTLCDFDSAMAWHLKQLAAPGEDLTIPRYTDLPHIKARRKLIKESEGFWENLHPFQLGFDIFNLLGLLGFKRHVLTKGPHSTTSAWTEKVKWCHKHIPGTPITISQDKGLVYGKVLVDDWPPYFLRWLEWRPRGLVVIPAQPWNEEYVDHPNCIRYDGSNIVELRKHLLKIRGGK